MVLPLMLMLGLSLGQAPDFLDVQPLGSGYQVLAGGGLVYRWSGRGELVLEAQLGAPTTALYTCDHQHAVAVGAQGQVHVSASGLAWRRVSLEGASDQVLRYARDGRDFQPVPVPYSHALLSVELLPGEELLAVGVREQFIRARPSGGAITYGSKAVQQWRTFIDKHQRLRMQPAPKAPPRAVAVTPFVTE